MHRTLLTAAAVAALAHPAIASAQAAPEPIDDVAVYGPAVGPDGSILSVIAGGGWRDGLDAAVEATRGWATELAIRAETAVVAGGIVLHRYRHTVAGGMIGCVAGAAVGTTVSAGAGLATGGAALAATGPAAALGCGVGAAYGASLGYPLDTMYDLP